MMLPTNRPPGDLPPPSVPLPTSQVTAAASAKPGLPHSDYNHQPLLVNGLEHYVKPDEDERFRVS
ncbi:hypothetical protein ABQJ54_18635 [Rhodanobacter sp. Si-c]|uniref:Uncharacterized protein n=1 Tax=Rhodanobacter lycopersici TaxID=3162487 RepID=A0ABV3QIU9_9GAMM